MKTIQYRGWSSLEDSFMQFLSIPFLAELSCPSSSISLLDSDVRQLLLEDGPEKILSARTDRDFCKFFDEHREPLFRALDSKLEADYEERTALRYIMGLWEHRYSASEIFDAFMGGSDCAPEDAVRIRASVARDAAETFLRELTECLKQDTV